VGRRRRPGRRSPRRRQPSRRGARRPWSCTRIGVRAHAPQMHTHEQMGTRTRTRARKRAQTRTRAHAHAARSPARLTYALQSQPLAPTPPPFNTHTCPSASAPSLPAPNHETGPGPPNAYQALVAPSGPGRVGSMPQTLRLLMPECRGRVPAKVGRLGKPWGLGFTEAPEKVHSSQRLMDSEYGQQRGLLLYFFVKVGKSPKYDLSITPLVAQSTETDSRNLMVKCIVATAA
jgi:hypothetical protein